MSLRVVLVLLISLALGLRNEAIRDYDLYRLKVFSFTDRDDTSDYCDGLFIFCRAWLKLSPSECTYITFIFESNVNKLKLS